MNKTLLFLAAAALTACAPTVKVEVENPTGTARHSETIELAWSDLAALRGLTAENVLVRDAAGTEIPSQVIYAGESEPQALIFQTDAAAGEKLRFTVGTGRRADYPAKAFGRHVPERYDDYAWENNLVAYRLYGPALETSPEKLITPGIDVWVKCSEKLVIDDWYAKGDYHHNYGDGMDCYKVGVTLGGGGSLPIADGVFWPMGHNYLTQQTLDNGPIRTTVRLTYAPFNVDGTAVSLTKTITLDADSRFNRMENRYEGPFGEMPVAAGFVRHDVKRTETGETWLAMVEPASDSKQPEADGDIYQGIVLPQGAGAAMAADTLGHAVAIVPVRSGEPMVYYSGSGWSQGGVADMEAWLALVAEQRAKIEQPLRVTLR